MKITLFINGEEKTFTVPFVKARMFRRALEITKKYDLNDVDVETLDVLVSYVVELFNNQFTIDDIYDGVPADKLIPTILDCINKVVGTVGKDKDPNA
ncbi:MULTISPECIES: phage tail assembly chaperone G [Anoxybacillaceae]|jgi:hypothetical protein|uniref:phage tail assembly chaperone G n=1 Tax=Anoxybacillaceae TaxID=3120669 RepID=UPI00018C1938|nr:MULTISPECIES: hypothetical protein [Bacillaceae]ADU95287.1 hypothetical protein GYMC52_2921 [Geobacillus sp. Y412MC52]